MEFSIDPMIIVLSVVIILLIVWVIRLEIRLKKLVMGKNARSLEDTIVRMGEKLVEFALHRKETEEYMSKLDKRIRKSISGLSTIRFNPFKDQGGNQSFATALLNEEGDGVVLSGLYGRDKVGIYAKPIIKHRSEHELSAEEKQALSAARDTRDDKPKRVV